MNTKPHVILIGKPGSGKGTIAKKLLANDTDFVHMSTGDIFRQHMSQKTDLGIEIQDVMDSVELVSDELTIAVVEDFMHNNKQKRIIFDGFPRTEQQSVWLCNELLYSGQQLPVVIELVCNDDICIERILERATLENRREDMSVEVIQNRLDIFENTTYAVIDFFDSVFPEQLVKINGEENVKTVFKQIHALLIQHTY
jgi:adenylate kinase